jgi:hypothetical protein
MAAAAVIVAFTFGAVGLVSCGSSDRPRANPKYSYDYKSTWTQENVRTLRHELKNKTGLPDAYLDGEHGLVQAVQSIWPEGPAAVRTSQRTNDNRWQWFEWAVKTAQQVEGR